MIVEWTIRFGDLLIIIGFLCTLLLFAFRVGKLVRSVQAVEDQIRALAGVTAQLSAVLITLAETKTEMSFLRRDIDEIRHAQNERKDH